MTYGAGIRFLPVSGRRLAYAVTGDGHRRLRRRGGSATWSWTWRTRRFEGCGRRSARATPLVRYDRLGVGMSDREVDEEELSLDAEVSLLGGVLDELGMDERGAGGGSSGGCAALAFAARFPERVSRLLLYGAYADGSSVTSPEVREALVATVRSHWGLGSRVLADILLGESNSAEQERLARYQRSAASPETAAALLEQIYRNDVRAEAAAVRAPTLVVHRRADRAIPYRLGRELAAAIPGATLVPLGRGAPISRGLGMRARWRVPCDRPSRPRRRPGFVESQRQCCSPAGSARCCHWSRGG